MGLYFFFLNCGGITPEKQLNLLISSYENYKDSQKEKSPLGNYDESRFENYAKFCDSLRLELEALKTEEFNTDAQISYDLLHFVLNEAVVKYQFKTHWNPILSDAGFHSSLTYRVRPLTNKKSALKYLKLLKAIPKYINQQSTLIKKGGSIVIEDINPKAIDIWITISNLLPANKFKSQIIEADGAILFLVKKI